MVLTIRCERQSSMDVLFREVWEISNNFLMRHSCGQPSKHIVDGNAQATNAGLPPPFAGFDRDMRVVTFHKGNLARTDAQDNGGMRLERQVAEISQPSWEERTQTSEPMRPEEPVTRRDL